jgi:hypothetical protein
MFLMTAEIVVMPDMCPLLLGVKVLLPLGCTWTLRDSRRESVETEAPRTEVTQSLQGDLVKPGLE